MILIDFFLRFYCFLFSTVMKCKIKVKVNLKHKVLQLQFPYFWKNIEKILKLVFQVFTLPHQKKNKSKSTLKLLPSKLFWWNNLWGNFNVQSPGWKLMMKVRCLFFNGFSGTFLYRMDEKFHLFYVVCFCCCEVCLLLKFFICSRKLDTWNLRWKRGECNWMWCEEFFLLYKHLVILKKGENMCKLCKLENQRV